jgi:hypothetical protein
MKLILILALLPFLLPPQEPDPLPIDFKKVDRTIAKPPPVSGEARYGIFLFGPNGEKRSFAILDKSRADAGDYDVLWFDLDADGDLAEEGERFASANGKFSLGDFTDPGSGARHRGFELAWTKEYVHFKMIWRGEKPTAGGYGPENGTYASFESTPQKAPIYVPGWDRPFEFEHWMSGTFKRGEETDFKVFVGNRGDRTGTFCSVDDRFLPATANPVATLIYTDAEGRERRTSWTLKKRC